MADVDEIMRRFEARSEDRAARPPRVEPVAPAPVRKYAPSDEKSRAILRGAAKVAEVMMNDYPEKSKEDAALYVLVTFARDMLGE